MQFDSYDNPKVRPTGVEVGPGSQMPTSSSTGAEVIVQGTRDIANAALVYNEERKKSGVFKSRENELRFAEEANKIDNEFRNRTDESALDTGPTLEKIEELRQKYADGLAGDELIDYDTRTRLRKLSMEDGLERHAADRRVKIYGAIADKALADMKSQAIKDYNNPAKVELALSLGLSTMTEYLSGHLKLPDTHVEKVLDQAQADVYADVLRAYVANRQVTAAKVYFDKIKDSLPADDVVKWEADLNKVNDDAAKAALLTQRWGVIESNATDPVKRRFNPELARAAVLELVPPDELAQIGDKLEHQIALAKQAQDERDVESVAYLKQGIRATGSLDRQDEAYLNLDHQGQNAAEEAEKLHQRLAMEDAKTQRIQNAVNTIAKNNFDTIALTNPKQASEMTDAQLELLSPGADEATISDLKKRRAAVNAGIAKLGKATQEGFGVRVSAVIPLIKQKWGDRGVAKWRDKTTAWWTLNTQGDKIPTEEEVNKYIGDQLLMLDFTWPSSNVPKFMMDSETEYKGIPYLDADDQDFEEAKKLLRGEYDTKATPGAAAATNPNLRRDKTGAEWMAELGLQGLDPNAVYTRVRENGKSKLVRKQ